MLTHQVRLTFQLRPTLQPDSVPGFINVRRPDLAEKVRDWEYGRDCSRDKRLADSAPRCNHRSSRTGWRLAIVHLQLNKRLVNHPPPHSHIQTFQPYKRKSRKKIKKILTSFHGVFAGALTATWSKQNMARVQTRRHSLRVPSLVTISSVVMVLAAVKLWCSCRKRVRLELLQHCIALSCTQMMFLRATERRKIQQPMRFCPFVVGLYWFTVPHSSLQSVVYCRCKIISSRLSAFNKLAVKKSGYL